MSDVLEDAFQLLRMWQKAAGENCIDSFLGPCLDGGYKCRLLWAGEDIPLVSKHMNPLKAVKAAVDCSPWPEDKL